MNLRALSAILAALLSVLASRQAAAQTLFTTAKTWQRWEQVLPTTKSYAACNPYRDVVLTVTYTNQVTGQTYAGYGFWDGTNPLNPSETRFKLRASFPTTGTWTWTTQRAGGPSGDRCGGDAAIAPRNGQVDVTASGPGRPPINTLGGLQVNTAAPNPRRYLVHSNGTPFLWVGDTAWSFWRVTTGQWSAYLNQLGPPTGRQQQGFTVVQVAMPIGTITGSQTQPVDGASNKPFVDSGCTGLGLAIPHSGCRWNPAFWQEFDRRINEANNKGFVVVVIGLFKRVVEQKNCNEQWWPEFAEHKIYARNVVARLAGNHVIFSPGFDEAPELSDPLSESDPSCNNVGVNNVNMACRARAIGNVIRNTLVRSTLDNKPLIGLVTHHIGGGCRNDGTCCTSDHWLAQFHPESWLDFHLFQSGQGANCPFGDALACLTERARERPQGLYALSSPTVKPNVNGEGVYDQFGFRYGPDPNSTACPKPIVGTPDARFTDTRARQVGYYSRLSGAFGHTLGVAGTWDFGFVTSETLTDGLGSPSSTQMKHQCTLLRNLEWHKLVPAPAKVFGQAVATTCTSTTAAESTKTVYAMDGTAGGGRFALAYLPPSSVSTLELETSGLLAFGSAWCQQWFNPRVGTYSADFNGTPVAGTTRYRFTKPDSNDWVLLLKDATLPCWTTPPQACPCLTASGGQYFCPP